MAEDACSRRGGTHGDSVQSGVTSCSRSVENNAESACFPFICLHSEHFGNAVIHITWQTKYFKMKLGSYDKYGLACGLVDKLLVHPHRPSCPDWYQAHCKSKNVWVDWAVLWNFPFIIVKQVHLHYAVHQVSWFNMISHLAGSQDSIFPSLTYAKAEIWDK